MELTEISENVLSKVRKDVESDIDMWVSVKVQDFIDVKEYVSEFLRYRFITVIVNKLHNDAYMMAPFLITTKGKHNVDLLYDSFRYRKLKGIKITKLIFYIEDSIIEEMKNKARIYLPYAKYEVFVFDTTKKPQRDYIIKLLIYNTLRVQMWDKYADLYMYRLMPFWDVFHTFRSYMEEPCHGEVIDAIDCVIRNLLKAKNDLRDALTKIAKRKLTWLKRKITLHNIVVRMAKQYINGFSVMRFLSDFNNPDRARMYYDRYHSYVEFDHVDKTVRIAVYNDNAIPLLSGYEENEKFVRIKLD